MSGVAHHFDIGSRCQIGVGLFRGDLHAVIVILIARRFTEDVEAARKGLFLPSSSIRKLPLRSYFRKEWHHVRGDVTCGGYDRFEADQKEQPPDS